MLKAQKEGQAVQRRTPGCAKFIKKISPENTEGFFLPFGNDNFL
jgi:hypothetical protein